MMANSLADVYQNHHRKHGRYAFSYRVQQRGPCFAAWIGEGVRVLDLGCRDGVLTQHYAQENDLVGVDVDPAALAAARARLGIDTCQLDLNRGALPFEDSSFDAAVAGELLEHLVSPPTLVTEVHRILRPGGIFVGSVPNSFHWRARAAFLLGRSIEDPTHLHLFSRRRLAQLLRDFASVDIIPIGGIGGRSIPILPPSLAAATIRTFPNWLANDWLFRAVKAAR